MKTTSLELSNQLRDAGAKQESSWGWYRGVDPTTEEEFFLLMPDGLPYEESGKGLFRVCSSFDCHELLERLPYSIPLGPDEKDGNGSLNLFPSSGEGSVVGNINYVWYAKYCLGHLEFADTPTEALGKLYLWCLQNGHCKE